MKKLSILRKNLSNGSKILGFFPPLDGISEYITPMRKLLFSICILTVGTVSAKPQKPARLDFSSMNEKVFSATTELGMPSFEETFKNEMEEEGFKNKWTQFATQIADLARKLSEEEKKNPEARENQERGRLLRSIANWPLLFELNIKAFDLWQRLLDCNGGSAETLRNNYFTGQVCRDSNREMKKSLRGLHRDLLNTLRTAEFFTPTPSSRAPRKSYLQESYDRISGQASPDVDHKDSKIVEWRKAFDIEFPPFHPLLSQMILEYYTLVNRVYMSPLQSVYYDSQGSGYIHHQVGVPPYLDFNYGISFIMRVTELAYWNEIGEENVYGKSGSYVTARSYLNSWHLMVLVGLNGCGDIGLWPEMSYATLFVVGSQILTDTSREVVRISELLTCDKQPRLQRQWRNVPWQINDRDLVRAYRRMGVEYGFSDFGESKCYHIGTRITRDWPEMWTCLTVDPAAPEDIEVEKNMKSGRLRKPGAQRMHDALNRISNF